MTMKNKIVSSACTKAALIAVAACVASPAAMAAVICNTTATPLSIPANLDGVYINLLTGANGTTGGGTAGWDINLYQTAAAGFPASLYFFWPAGATTNGGVSLDGTTYAYLADGASVGPASTFIASSGGGGEPPYVNYRVTQSGGSLGVRFLNEGTGVANYGWLKMSTTAATGYPATITSFCFQNNGTAITTGTTPVALQNFSVD